MQPGDRDPIERGIVRLWVGQTMGGLPARESRGKSVDLAPQSQRLRQASGIGIAETLPPANLLGQTVVAPLIGRRKAVIFNQLILVRSVTTE